MEVKLIAHTQNPVAVIEEAASTCYDSEPTANGLIMKDCIKHGHESVTEHTIFTFKIFGVSRALMAQLTRHRIGTAFSIRSQRYCNEQQFDYITPPDIAKNEKTKQLYDLTMQNIAGAYEMLVAAGIKKEDARFLLPNACETVITFSCNFRELRHICAERLCSRAQWEIRQMTQRMVDEVVAVFPEAKPYLVPKCETNPQFPFCTERNCCGRHKTLKEVYKND